MDHSLCGRFIKCKTSNMSFMFFKNDIKMKNVKNNLNFTDKY